MEGGQEQTREENADVDEEEQDFAFSRNCFLSKEHASGKKSVATRKLSDIAFVDEQKLREAVIEIAPKHEKEIESLLSSYKNSYQQWFFQLRCGFNLLFYGFGSKKLLLEDFCNTSMVDNGVIVINGYLQSINVKQVAVAIAEVYWNQIKNYRKRRPTNSKSFDSESIEDILSFLDGDHCDDDGFVCVVIHNIDGPGLRNSDSQQYLAKIASCSHVCVIASVDHVNAPLLWNKKMVCKQFNWCWYHVPTFEAYKVEGIFFPLILAGGVAAQSAKTALIVLQSLTPNAQSMFKIIIEHQLAHPKEEGMPRSKLYNSCRERFLVSSQMTMNSHLTEFKDHELVKMRKHREGQDCFYVPLNTEALEKLLLELG